MWADASHWAVIIVQLLTLLVVLFAARKAVSAARIAEEAKRTARRSALRATQQLEALDGLYARLHLERGTLPPTRGWAASPDFLTILYDHAARERPEFILECGSGVSTLVLARCLQQIGHGHILSLDHDAAFGERTREHIERLGLSEYAEVCIAPLVPQEIGTQELVWYDLSKVDLPDRIDLVVVDGPP